MHVRAVIDHTKISADLTAFPLYVDLAGLPDDFWNVVTDGGGDIRCYTSDGSELAREVVSCDTTARTGELHVKTDLSSTVDTTVRIDADGQRADYSPTDPHGRDAVWSQGFWYVSHDALSDSTGSTMPTVSGTVTSVDGFLGPAARFTGASPSSVSANVGVNDPVTFTAWIDFDFPNNLNGVDHYNWLAGWMYSLNLVMRTYPSQPGPGYFLWLRGTSAGGAVNDISVLWYIPSPLRGWHLVGASFGAGIASLLVDGQVVASRSFPGNSVDMLRDAFTVGGNAEQNYWLASIVDEVRASDVVRGPAWLAAEYANQSDPASFYAIMRDIDVDAGPLTLGWGPISPLATDWATGTLTGNPTTASHLTGDDDWQASDLTTGWSTGPLYTQED